LAANISETDEDIQIQIFIPSTVIPPVLGKTSPVKFGPVTLETHPHGDIPTESAFFGRPYFGPLGMLRPQIFTRARK